MDQPHNTRHGNDEELDVTSHTERPQRQGEGDEHRALDHVGAERRGGQTTLEPAVRQHVAMRPVQNEQ